MSIDIAGLSGSKVHVSDSVVAKLCSALRGETLTPGDPHYEDVRILNNAMIGKRPALIVRCTGTADVMACVNFVREHGLLSSVRGGGHGVAGNALCEGGLMIDLSGMRAVRVDPQARIAWVQGGCELGEVDHETQAFGLVAPAGVVSTTGVAGLTLGGGYGWVRSKYGMSIDNLQGVDIVTADGRLRHASESENPDLFWAVRGGGGNFGVVTTFEFRLHPLGPEVMHCMPFYAGDEARKVLQAWREFMAGAPDEFTAEFFFWTVPDHPAFPEAYHGLDVVIPAGVYAGPAEEGERFVQPLREIGAGPALDLSARRRFTEVQSMFDPFMPKGATLNYWKSLYFQELADEVIDTLIEIFHGRPTVRLPLVLHNLHGASARVPADATAFGGRGAKYLLEFNSSWTDPAQNDHNIEWTRRTWQKFYDRFASGTGGYLNMNNYNEDGVSFVQTTYGQNYKRLQEIKKKYDPGNLFRMNANILPAP